MRKKGKVYMAIDQYGNTHHNLRHPRKALMEIVGRKSARKMFVDMKDGKSRHVGYVVGKLWFRLFEITPFGEPV